MNDSLLLIARILVAVLFLGGAVQKAISPQDAAALLIQWGLPAALVWPALVYNAGAGVLLILGLWLRPVAQTLVIYCAVTSLFHLMSAPLRLNAALRQCAKRVDPPHACFIAGHEPRITCHAAQTT